MIFFCFLLAIETNLWTHSTKKNCTKQKVAQRLWRARDKLSDDFVMMYTANVMICLKNSQSNCITTTIFFISSLTQNYIQRIVVGFFAFNIARVWHSVDETTVKSWRVLQWWSYWLLHLSVLIWWIVYCRFRQCLHHIAPEKNVLFSQTHSKIYITLHEIIEASTFVMQI